MAMKNVVRITMAFVFAACVSAATAQEKAKKPAAKPTPPDEKAMMEAWQKASTPGEMHKKLDAMAGTLVNSWTLGDRFVEQKYEGTFMGQPFTGIGYVGYDNVKKKYVSVWMDSAGTGMMSSVMTSDPEGKVFTAKSTVDDPMTGKPTPIESK